MTPIAPDIIPIFPLAQAILLPRGRLPLNIFEPRYLQMTDDALRGGRHIGMVQPADAANAPKLHHIGCVGRLTAWEETGDGRLHISLVGVTRFRIVDEIEVATPYRQVRADYSPYAGDTTPAQGDIMLDRPQLFAHLKRYLEGQHLQADWSAIENAPAEALINSLAMICPFGAAEKQALVEAHTLQERAAVFTALIEIAAAGAAGPRLQ